MEGEERPADSSVKIPTAQDSTTALFNLESYSGYFQLKEYSKAIRNNSSTDTRVRIMRTISGSLSSKMTLDEMLHYQDDPLTIPLLHSSKEMAFEALEMFSIIRTFLKSHDISLTTKWSLETTQSLLRMGLKYVELRDELFIQLLKQSRGNCDPQSKLRIWVLFSAVASTMPPSKHFAPLLTHYISLATQDIHEVCKNDSSMLHTLFRVKQTNEALKTTLKAGARVNLPSKTEINKYYKMSMMTTEVHFLDNSLTNVFYGLSTTVRQAVRNVAQIINLMNYEAFSIFKSVHKEDNQCLLEDNLYIGDILLDFEIGSSRDLGNQKLIFKKKKTFSDSDNEITETQFQNLLFMQAQHDFFLGLYPVTVEDAVKLCALQLCSKYGSKFPRDDKQLTNDVEKFITKQIKLSSPKKEWKQDVMIQFKKLKLMSQRKAKNEFLKTLRSLVDLNFGTYSKQVSTYPKDNSISKRMIEVLKEEDRNCPLVKKQKVYENVEDMKERIKVSSREVREEEVLNDIDELIELVVDGYLKLKS